MTEALQAVANKLAGIPPHERAEVVASALRLTAGFPWAPLVGPQMDGYFSPAHELYYGGAGGGGKTDLLIGLALTMHKRSLVLRRQYTDLGSIVDRTLELHGSRRGYNGAAPPRLTTDSGKIIDFGAAARPGDEQHWQGNPHDLLAVDEAAQFQEFQILYLMGWVRTTDPKQRKRIVLCSNPPLTSEGEWLTRRYSSWLDKQHPNRAAPGELRWFATDQDGRDMEVDGPSPIEINGELIEPLSRTFIPAALKDNPYLLSAGY